MVLISDFAIQGAQMALVLLLAVLSSWTFDLMPRLVTEAMSD